MVTHTTIMKWRHDVMALTLLIGLAMLVAGPALANPRYAAIVVDMESGEVLHAANADATRYPASLTKLMTLYLVFEALEKRSLSLGQGLPVSSYAASKPASKLYVKPGSTIPVETAIQALVIKSANDVAVVVAESLGGSEASFARMMTDKARQLGMMRTTFRNPNGLPDAGQTTTARDMTTLSIRLMQDFPQYYHYFSRTSFTWQGKTITGHNRLLDNYPGADGMKTGFIRASGFNVATSAVRDGRRLLSVVMGGFTAQSRDAHMAELLDRGFVRASLYNRGDWIARADFSGDVMSGTRSLPASAPATPVSEPSRMVASLDSQTTQATQASQASQASQESSATTYTRRPGVEQGSADDPIRELITRTNHSFVPVDTFRTQTGGGWGVQVGAFSSADQARILANRAADRLAFQMSDARIAVAEHQGDHKVFRARLVNLQENQAYDACRSLVQEGMDCMVVNAGR